MLVSYHSIIIYDIKSNIAPDQKVAVLLFNKLMATKPSAFYSVKELASLFAVSPNHIYRLAESGQIPCYKIGRIIRFAHEDIKDFLVKTRIG